MKILMGNVHQGDIRFPYHGRQCTSISIFACLYALEKNPRQWTIHDIFKCIKVSDQCQYKT